MKLRHYAVFMVFSAAVAGAVFWLSEAAKERRIIEAQKQNEKDALTIAAAKQLDEQWHTTFEKTGKYPNDPSFHTHIFSALAEIYRRNPQQSEALELRDRFWQRQKKIDDIENKRIGGPPKLKLVGALDSSYGVLHGNIEINNSFEHPIADVVVNCDVFASSGTVIHKYHFILYDVFPAKRTKTLNNYNFGFYPAQGKNVSCNIGDFQKR